jgi:shikimate dehydrogenase
MTQVFGIIGDPIAQVRSPEVFNRLFRERQLDAIMVPMLVTADGLENALAGLHVIGNLGGLIITVPHKPAAAGLLLSRSESVRIAGAANALRPVAGGWDGALFDGEGFAIGLEARGYRLSGKHCSIVGAGGAGAAIALALLQREIGSLSVWDVDLKKVEALLQRLGSVSSVPMSIKRPDRDSDLAVNATPLGMQPYDPLPFDVQSLRSDALVADAIMKPPLTRLLLEAGQRGRAIQEGRHMLDNQVSAIWRFLGLP